jgi:hypothetical protein
MITQETLEELKKWKEEALIAHEINQKVIEKLMAERKLMYSEEDLEVAYFEGREGLYSFNDWLKQFKNK